MAGGFWTQLARSVSRLGAAAPRGQIIAVDTKGQGRQPLGPIDESLATKLRERYASVDEMMAQDLYAKDTD